jgi:hypothetical protein
MYDLSGINGHNNYNYANDRNLLFIKNKFFPLSVYMQKNNVAYKLLPDLFVK